MDGFSGRNRRTLLPVLVVAALIAVVIGVVRVTQPSQSAPTPAPGPVSAIDACHLPVSDAKAGGTYQWQMAVRLDSPQETAMVFISGSSLLQCETYRGPDGTFFGSTTGVGDFRPGSGTVLTYDTGSSPAQGGTYPTAMVIGRVPSGTASVDVVTTDGEHHSATIGNGWYVAWAATTGPGDDVVEISARDSAGRTIARLADPSGLQAGRSPALVSQ